MIFLIHPCLENKKVYFRTQYILYISVYSITESSSRRSCRGWKILVCVADVVYKIRFPVLIPDVEKLILESSTTYMLEANRNK